MKCLNCQTEIPNGSKSCSRCGRPIVISAQFPHPNQHYQPSPVKAEIKKQPTAALVVEGIGLLDFLYCFLSASSDSYDAKRFVNGELFSKFILFGFALMVIAFILFRIFKRSAVLEGVGYVGYIVSIILVVIAVIILILSIVLFGWMMFTVGDILSL